MTYKECMLTTLTALLWPMVFFCTESSSVLCLCTYSLCFRVLHNTECRVQGSGSYLHSKFDRADAELISKGKKIINILCCG